MGASSLADLASSCGQHTHARTYIRLPPPPVRHPSPSIFPRFYLPAASSYHLLALTHGKISTHARANTHTDTHTHNKIPKDQKVEGTDEHHANATSPGLSTALAAVAFRCEAQDVSRRREEVSQEGKGPCYWIPSVGTHAVATGITR